MKANHWTHPYHIESNAKGTAITITLRRRHPRLYWMLLTYPVTVSRWNPRYWRVLIPAAVRLWRGETKP